MSNQNFNEDAIALKKNTEKDILDEFKDPYQISNACFGFSSLNLILHCYQNKKFLEKRDCKKTEFIRYLRAFLQQQTVERTRGFAQLLVFVGYSYSQSSQTNSRYKQSNYVNFELADAANCLSYIFQSLEKEIKNLEQRYDFLDYLDYKKYVEDQIGKDQALFKSTKAQFYLNCGQKRNAAEKVEVESEQPDFSFLFSLSRYKSVQDFLDKETENQKIQCRGCGKEVELESIYVQYPYFLTVLFPKPVGSHSNFKINKEVSLKGLNSEGKVVQVKYKLKGIIRSSGIHYTYFKLDKDNKWSFISDDKSYNYDFNYDGNPTDNAKIVLYINEKEELSSKQLQDSHTHSYSQEHQQLQSKSNQNELKSSEKSQVLNFYNYQVMDILLEMINSNRCEQDIVLNRQNKESEILKMIDVSDTTGDSPQYIPSIFSSNIEDIFQELSKEKAETAKQKHYERGFLYKIFPLNNTLQFCSNNPLLKQQILIEFQDKEKVFKEQKVIIFNHNNKNNKKQKLKCYLIKGSEYPFTFQFKFTIDEIYPPNNSEIAIYQAEK